MSFALPPADDLFRIITRFIVTMALVVIAGYFTGALLAYIILG